MTTKAQNNEQCSKNKTAIIPMLISFLAFPVCYMLDHQSEEMTPMSLFIQAIGVLTVIAIIIVVISSSSTSSSSPNDEKKLDKFFYIFSFTSYTCMMDLIFACTAIDNKLIISWGNFYFTKGEPYLASTFGAVINTWDATVHYSLYMHMTRKLATHQSVGYPGFFWVGSIMNSLLVFLPGNLIGAYGHSVTISYILNFPFFIMPIVFCVKLFKEATVTQKNSAHKNSRSFLEKIMDMIVLSFAILVIALMIFKALIVLGSQGEAFQWWAEQVEPNIMNTSGYPKMQALIHVFYYVPFYFLVAIRAVWPNVGDSLMFSQWSAIFFGASLQGQWSYVLPALFELDSIPSTYPGGEFIPIPSEGKLIFWVVNVALCVLPGVVFARQFTSDTKKKVKGI